LIISKFDELLTSWHEWQRKQWYTYENWENISEQLMCIHATLTKLTNGKIITISPTTNNNKTQSLLEIYQSVQEILTNGKI
jgi:hypothetical protein